MSQQFDILKAIYNDTKDEKYQYAILPWGATEPHNYHLPYLTDCYLSHDVAVDAAIRAYEQGRIKGMVLPPIPLGSQNPGQRELPFCLHTRYETQKAILTDIVASLDYQGISKLFIVNGHGGNSFKNMIRDLAVDYPHFLIVVSDWFAIVPQIGFFDEKDDHAGELETSVLMHYRPELVDLSVAGNGVYFPFRIQALRDGTGWIPRNWAKVSQDTGIGNPLKSTAEKGRRYVEAVSNKLADLFISVVEDEIY
ncbi:creatinine amidohydrolase [Dysgonomonas sp. PFB1-18]|uniref:creatininase family protein n=1 Tax=unclassified Dysgonomonas TaxID=2630389 RepID=UPI002475DBA1|nr:MULTISPECIES: creatininase family protein [unclassified Dysgonomonas]MDH6307828.1 creatinine amidohydrolase [Dysgonomonas sp. PF1-14]MDH6337746.1 creatinine amidohydrolase [Dysgonomonas sp. PF1-16]MDH6378970.1 creatinine amidohydrolase [Dysgonomonas sp. PFB1-18]MDH6396605.1 creatinine amidohydrolase [Dysgonomonas sp. PF1-23]